MKKTMSLFLALAMVFALAIPAFAQQQNDPTSQTVEVAGALAAPSIQIEAPTSVTLTLNPYQMKYSGDIKLLQGQDDQILSLPATFVNKTNGKLSVELAAEAKKPTTVTLKTTTAVAETTKVVFLQMQFGMVKDKTGAEWDGTEPSKATFATDGKLDYKSTYTGFATAGQAPALSVAATDGKAANYFAFLFSGDMAKKLATGTWTDDDKIPVTVAFKFNVVNPTASGS